MPATTAEPDLRYPVGKSDLRSPLSQGDREIFIANIQATPKHLRAAVAGLSKDQFQTPYRPGGWTVLQTVHHIADSHMNAYIRFKLALTEEAPTVKPYDEALWAKLADSDAPPEVSLSLMDNIHERWVRMLHAMTSADFGRKLTHPERGQMDLDQMLCLYDWHGRHHVAHITSLRQRNGW